MSKIEQLSGEITRLQNENAAQKSEIEKIRIIVLLDLI
jgi:hypothetical protein